MLRYDSDSLEVFTKDISDTENAKAEQSIKMVQEAINDYDWISVELRCPTVKLKGSYHNNTNVRIDSDVDIYVLFDGYFWIDTPKQCISPEHKGDGKSCEYFREHLEKALKNRFVSQIKKGNKVFKIKETSYKHEADIMTAFPAKDDKKNHSYDGVRLFFNNDSKAITYPEQNKLNSDRKDLMTAGYYKKMVRVFKGIKNDLNLDTPSFLIECMVYSVPNEFIMDSSKNYLGKARNIVNIWSQFLPNRANEFIETNEIKILFHQSQKWGVDDGVNFINKMKEVLW